MNYWLDLFTGTTWQEFQDSGGTVSGFREHNRKRATKVKPGDVFLCYMVGVKRWVGLLEVTGGIYKDDTRIWKEEIFPVRFPVKPLVILSPEHGVPMESLKGKLTFYEIGMTSKQWSGYVRSSPTKYSSVDGEVIAQMIREAKANPESRAVNQKDLTRSSNLYKVSTRVGSKNVETIVSIPSKDEEEITEEVVPGFPTHVEIQYRLLDLGAQMNFEVWAPKSDRRKTWNRKSIGDIVNLVDVLPKLFDEATNKTIENIDVLWLKGHAIISAFEVEHTTSIYSGLLRMADLLTMQPNLDIKIYLVAPDERLDKFKREVARPTFASRRKPVHSVCRFIPYTALSLS